MKKKTESSTSYHVITMRFIMCAFCGFGAFWFLAIWAEWSILFSVWYSQLFSAALAAAFWS